MTDSSPKSTEFDSLSTELKAEQALGLIGIGLMKRISQEGLSGLDWSTETNREKTDLSSLRQRLEITAMAIETGAPLTTSEITQILGAKPGAAEIQRGGLLARKISRNVWRLTKSEKENTYWRN